MTREESINEWIIPAIKNTWNEKRCKEIIKALEQEPCEMTAEEYRQRMIQAFHNADCDELIAICVLPTEKEFEHLEWLLEKHYKAKPELCPDAISRQAALRQAINAHKMAQENGFDFKDICEEYLNVLPPEPKIGRWIDNSGYGYTQYYCSCCFDGKSETTVKTAYCSNCEAKMQGVESEG